jgi:hypothetical protein
VTITLSGNATDVFVFRVGTGGLGALTLNSTQIVAGGSVRACNVFWKAAEGITLNSANAIGTMMAGTAFVSTGATLVGRGFAKTDVTLTSSTLSFAGCAAAPAPPPGPGSGLPAQVPTLSEWAMIMLAGLLAFAGFAAIRRRNR